MAKCLNCGNEFSGDYCSHCGQKRADSRLTLGEILSDFIQTAFLFDGSLYRTLSGMLFRPGELIRSYVGGKRKTYLPPFQYFFLFMTLYLLVLNYLGDDIFRYLNSGLTPGGNTVSRVQPVQTLVRRNMNIMDFLMTPIFAFYVWIFHRKSRINYAESAIFSVYVTGTGFFLSVLIVLLSLIETRFYMMRVLILFVYYPVTLIAFTREKILPGLIRSWMTVICSYLTFILLISSMVILYLVITK